MLCICDCTQVRVRYYLTITLNTCMRWWRDTERNRSNNVLHVENISVRVQVPTCTHNLYYECDAYGSTFPQELVVVNMFKSVSFTRVAFQFKHTNIL